VRRNTLDPKAVYSHLNPENQSHFPLAPNLVLRPWMVVGEAKRPSLPVAMSNEGVGKGVEAAAELGSPECSRCREKCMRCKQQKSALLSALSAFLLRFQEQNLSLQKKIKF
jgi:hypothetical protein